MIRLHHNFDKLKLPGFDQMYDFRQTDQYPNKGEKQNDYKNYFYQFNSIFSMRNISTEGGKGMVLIVILQAFLTLFQSLP